MFETLFLYYGLDWMSSLIGLAGLYLISEKKSAGFIFTAIAVVMAAIVALMAHQYGFLLANGITFLLAIRGYMRW